MRSVEKNQSCRYRYTLHSLPNQYFLLPTLRELSKLVPKGIKGCFKRSSNTKKLNIFFGAWDSFDAYTSEPQTSLERPIILGIIVILIG